MRQQKPHQFLAGVTGCADDADFYFIIHGCLNTDFHLWLKKKNPARLNLRGGGKIPDRINVC